MKKEKTISNGKLEKKSQSIIPKSDFNNVLDNLLIFKSQKELEKTFGIENIKTETTGNIDSESENYYTVLFPNTKNEILFFWKNEKELKILDFIKISEKNVRWLTKDDLRIGLRLKDLEKINKKTFTFYNFESELLSGKIDWDNGFLSNRNVSGKLSPPKFEDPHYSTQLDKASFEGFSKLKKIHNSSRFLTSYDIYLSEIKVWNK
ncbi:hypothetical protein H9W90_10025 [Polaribacter pectinis]|uniref:Uncharacterized protein n=1 Tax=Polaribacter pectinis TaxID=2738844 RepID=A0A7G9L7D4_9FLAO|nr:hypothetical protein [Polaribacter pectinis]QNM84533.1 hypothetical protein H9W90_10025 [Polaribacter pectinis]